MALQESVIIIPYQDCLSSLAPVAVLVEDEMTDIHRQTEHDKFWIAG
ncbi:hypothetical protein ABMA32_06800 [Mesorhizobium sp. VNQ89]